MAWMHLLCIEITSHVQYHQPSQAETLYIEEHRGLYLRIKTATICASEAV